MSDSVFSTPLGTVAAGPTLPTPAPPRTVAALPGWIDRFTAASVSPCRVTSPDLPGQLRQIVAGRSVDTILCSALDTDPSVELNAAVAVENAEAIAAGLRLLKDLTGAARVWVAADAAKPADWFATVRGCGPIEGLRLASLGADYPQADPSLLVYTVTDRRLKPAALPTTCRVLLLDAPAAAAVGAVGATGAVIGSTPLAIRDHFTARTHLLRVAVGTTVAAACAAAGVAPAAAVYRGGDFLRDGWTPADAPVGNGELVFHVTAPQINANPDPCIRCGWCVEACPTRVHPAAVLQAAQTNDKKAGEKYGLSACIECGICTYVCPTRLPLLSAIRGLKHG